MAKKLFFLNIAFLALALASCSNKTIFNERHEFPSLKWNHFDPVAFSVEVTDMEPPYDISLNMRHITQMPYESMPVLIIVKSPSGSIRTFLHTFKIKGKDGKLLGDGMGDIWDLDDRVKKQFFFNETGKYVFTIKDAGSNYDNIGIMTLGLKVEKTKINK